MSLPLINTVPGSSGRSMIFFVDPKSNEISQFSAPQGLETTSDERKNYDGPVVVKSQQNQRYTTNSSDLAAVSLMNDKNVLTIRIYYIGTDTQLKEIWRDATAPDNSGAWQDGDLNQANIKTSSDTPISAYYDTDNKQLRVYFFAPRGKIPSVAFQEGGKWTSKPILRL